MYLVVSLEGPHDDLATDFGTPLFVGYDSCSYF